MKILFSPVGMTDPVSLDSSAETITYHEGPLLQICRHYQPDLVYIYLSKEAYELEENDHRYSLGLELLQKDIGKSFDIKKIERPDLVGVHIFDSFIDEYKNLLKGIRKDYPDAEILVNVSSGTSAMNSALQSLAAATELGLKPIQVSTYTKKSNMSKQLEVSQERDIKAEWENNVDRKPDSENRVKESVNNILLFEFNKKQLVSLINNYDYHSAQLLAQNMDVFIPVKFRELLNAVVFRYDLKIDAAKKLFDKSGYSRLMKNSNIASEYLMLLDIKVKKKEYLDFLRAVTPLILEVFYDMTKKKLGVDLTDYTKSDEKYSWDESNLKDSPIDGKFDQLKKYHGTDARPMPGKRTYPNNYILSWHISNLAENLATDDNLVYETIKIREFEEKARNLAAHTMTPFTQDDIITETGLAPEDMIPMIRDYIMKYTDIPVDDSTLTVYDEINKKLIELLG